MLLLHKVDFRTQKNIQMVTYEFGIHFFINLPDLLILFLCVMLVKIIQGSRNEICYAGLRQMFFLWCSVSLNETQPRCVVVYMDVLYAG